MQRPFDTPISRISYACHIILWQFRWYKDPAFGRSHAEEIYYPLETFPLQLRKAVEFYNVFKDSYTPSIYLDVTRKNPNRKTLVKLRISNHKLNIETGRYDKISRCDRICPVCSLDVEDKIHFLFDCAKHSPIGDDFFNKIANRIPNYNTYQF